MTAPRVFVSRAAVLGPAERGIATTWSAALERLRLAPVELTRAEYLVPPWPQLRDLLRSCQGVLVLGFRERPTPWNQVEAGLGIMAGLPVLVATDDRVSDGVFAPGAWGEGVSGVGLRVWERPEPLAEAALQEWLSSVRSRR